MTVIALGVPSVRVPADAPAPADGPLVDTFGRVATDLRVSLTDRCNLRCTYCMPAEGLDWLPGDAAAEHRRTGPAAAHRRDPARHHQRPVHRRRAVGRQASRGRRRGDRRAATPARDHVDHQRHRAGAARGRTRSAPGWTGSTCRWTPSTPRASPHITRRDRLADVLAGLAARQGRRAGPGQGQRRARSGDRARRRGRAAAVLPGARVPAAHHRADAAGRRATSGGAARRIDADDVLGSAAPPLHVDARLRRRGARRRRELWRVDGGPGATGRHHRVGVACVLRGVRPHPADRRRPGAQLPVRDARRPICAACCAAAPTTTRSKPAWRAAMWAKAAGHGINDPSFVQPDRPMSAIGG